MAKTWKDSDISLDTIKDQTIAIIGYGIQGDAQANNLKDSGLKVIVGLKEGGSSWNKAKDDGHEVMSVAEACKKADIPAGASCHQLPPVLSWTGIGCGGCVFVGSGSG